MDRNRAIFLFCLVALSAPAWAAPSTTTTTAETYDGTLADATWRLGTYDQIDATGGHPGAFLHNPQLDSAVPTPYFAGTLPSPFFGNYRTAKVTSLGLDVNVFAASIGVDPGRPMSIDLSSDMGTPADTSDDCEVYLVSGRVPRPGSGWHAIDFKVPSSSTTLPNGWVVRGSCAGLDANGSWNAVITNVTGVQFPFADPDTFWYYQIWDLGLDNVRVTMSAR